MNQKEIIELTEKLICDFSDLMRVYLSKMNISAVPSFKLKPTTDWKNPISLNEIVSLVNTSIEDIDKYPEGLRTKCRSRYIVTRRYVVAYITREMRYPVEVIGAALNINHSTVIHGYSMVPTLLKNKDPDMTEAYNSILSLISAYYKEKYGEDLPKIGQ